MKAVNEEYQTRSLDELGEAALTYIRRCPGARCGAIGDAIFKDHVHTLRGSAPFARLAGKVMRHLERQGKARSKVTRGWHGSLAGAGG
jgi:hypothetical protein